MINDTPLQQMQVPPHLHTVAMTSLWYQTCMKTVSAEFAPRFAVFYTSVLIVIDFHGMEVSAWTYSKGYCETSCMCVPQIPCQ